MNEHILSIDQSVHATKAMLFSHDGELLVHREKRHPQLINEQGWVENDPGVIFSNVLKLVPEVLQAADADPGVICAMGLTNQRETVVAWDRSSGEPICNAILTQCVRGESICSELHEKGLADEIREITGTELAPYYSAAKMAWILRNVPAAKELAARGQLCLGTMDSWLVFRLTQGREFRTDFSNAARTQLLNLHTLEWDEKLCEAFGVPMQALPEPTASDGDFGSTDFGGLLAHEVPIRAVLGDANAALYGQGCIEPGMVKATYSAGTSVMLNTGSRRIKSSRLASSIAWGSRENMTYVLEGNINYTGSVVTWLKNEMQMIGTLEATERLARAANPADTTYFVPAFTGLGAPYWEPEARAVVCGMSRATGRAEFVKAALESIAYQVADVLAIMEQEATLVFQELRADGGSSANDYLMQFQSDIIGRPVDVSSLEEIAALGAAFMAGEAIGLYTPMMLLAACSRRTLSPRMPAEVREAKYAGWTKAVQRTLWDT